MYVTIQYVMVITGTLDSFMAVKVNLSEINENRRWFFQSFEKEGFENGKLRDQNRLPFYYRNTGG